MGGRYLLPVCAEVREGAGVAAGDEVDVDVEPDTEPRTVEVPPDIAEARAGDVEAKQFFDGLSYSNQRRLVMSIEDAKTPETRRKRIEKTVSMLHEGRVEAAPKPEHPREPIHRVHAPSANRSAHIVSASALQWNVHSEKHRVISD